MRLLFANNATSPLQIAVGVSDTDVYVNANDAALYPSPVQGEEYFKVTLDNLATGQKEICHCTLREDDRLYVVRAQENTVATAFPVGTLVSNRATRDTFTELFGAAFDWGSQYLGGLNYYPTVDNNGDPVGAGCMFFHTGTKTVYVFDGADWRTFDKPAPTSGQRLVYTTTGMELSGVDDYGNTMNLDTAGTEPVAVHKNGVRLVETRGAVIGGYTVDYANNKIDLTPGGSGTYHVDVLTPASELALGGVSTTKIEDISGSFDGTEKNFTLNNEASGQPVTTTANATTIAIDGVIQEPGVAYTIAGSTITFTIPPTSDATFWGMYNTSGDSAAVVYVGDSEPQNASEGWVWYDKSAGVARAFIYIVDASGDGFWVDLAPDRFGENATNASNVVYDNTVSEMDAENVQEAIDELKALIPSTTENTPQISVEDELPNRMQLAVVTTLPAQPDPDTIYFIKSV